MDWEDRVLHSAFNKFFTVCCALSHCVLGAYCGGGNVSLCDILECWCSPIPPTRSVKTVIGTPPRYSWTGLRVQTTSSKVLIAHVTFDPVCTTVARFANWISGMQQSTTVCAGAPVHLMPYLHCFQELEAHFDSFGDSHNARTTGPGHRQPGLTLSPTIFYAGSSPSAMSSKISPQKQFFS